MTAPRSPIPAFEHLLDRRHLLQSITPGEKLLVGVSGGADSVALLLALHRLHLPAATIAAVHINHGLRAEAAAEQQFVEDLCRRLGIPIHVVELTGAESIRHGSAEAHWRQLRYKAFAEVMQEHHYTALLLGHTADDLAETFLFHLVRGTGLAGLTFHFEKSQHGVRILRPFWKTRRADIEATLQHHQQPWMDDPSNNDVRHTRNRIRHTIMPALQEINPDATGAILRAATAIGQIVPPNPTDPPQTQLLLEPYRGPGQTGYPLTHALQALAAARELGLSSRQIDQAVAMITENKVGTVALTGCASLIITQEFAWILPEDQPDVPTLARAHIKEFSGLYASFPEPQKFSSQTSLQALDGTTYHLTVSDTSAVYHLRNRIPGDRLGSQPLKAFFNEQKIPWYLRDFIPLLLGPDGKILAVLNSSSAIIAASQRKSGCATRIDIQAQP